MELKDVIEARASVRQFADEEVCNDDLREMVRLAHLAPSVNNSQPWRFVAIKNRLLFEDMAAAVHMQDRGDAARSDDEMRRERPRNRWIGSRLSSARRRQ